MTATLDWYGCATFRLRTAEGLTVWLDAYLDRVPDAEQSGVGVDDVTAADWILVGHSHFDHLWGAERIAVRTGATVVGSYESVRVLAAAGVPEEQLLAVAGGERVALDASTSVRVLPSLHSCVWSSQPMPPADEVCLGETGLTLQDRTERMRALWAGFGAMGEDVRAHMKAADQGERGDGGALVFVVETSEGSLLFQDSIGSWSGVLGQQAPDVAILAVAGRGNRDGEPVQGTTADFVTEQTAALGARTVVPCHHDDWLPGFSRAIDTAPVRAAIDRAAPGTALVDLGYASGYALFR
ncbi:L-ascorbate metabolism protein UlaG (beta-lactamase superfamily) [Actinomycetospora succinea]|uniref:L-ascorbate metabolism protein UlaG (Beta-lactamase superfamily) n=1 Tax=Actinomycetospora succinea TaxID=663603 RepID=A0A4R6VE45_9PSEU|nr:MBL fold metallo-hydrolase [Actinomycetospora succinea]TDQ58690.1 L-ascorbate metabolism protein UlaG (beta-lactamase superfamily) [Actinomycetospora succinea]